MTNAGALRQSPLLALLALAGCGSGVAKEVIAVTETYATSACACRDAGCGDGAEAVYEQSMASLSAKNAGRTTGMTDAEQKRVAEAHSRAIACRTKLGPTPRSP